MKLLAAAFAFALASISLAVHAADYPAPKESAWTARDFKFHTGETLPEVRLAYTTVGDKGGEPVLVFHGTGGFGAQFLSPAFAGELFGPGQPLDASRYFIVLPDALGHGKSTKPSDGLKAKFPRYNIEDLVVAAHRLATEGLGLKHVRLVIGNSMGGMETWIYAEKYPDFMDVAAPMASSPAEMAGRNYLMRRMIVDSIRNDPEWKNGEYTTQPKSPRFAVSYFQVAMNGGNRRLAKVQPTREKSDAAIEAQMKAFHADANDTLYHWDSSRDYNASPDLERIRATVLAINSADDERYPPEAGVMEREIRRVKNGRAYLIPASDETNGHGTTGSAKWWKKELDEVLKTAPRGL